MSPTPITTPTSTWARSFAGLALVGSSIAAPACAPVRGEAVTAAAGSTGPSGSSGPSGPAGPSGPSGPSEPTEPTEAAAAVEPEAPAGIYEVECAAAADEPQLRHPLRSRALAFEYDPRAGSPLADVADYACFKYVCWFVAANSSISSSACSGLRFAALDVRPVPGSVPVRGCWLDGDGPGAPPFSAAVALFAELDEGEAEARCDELGEAVHRRLPEVHADGRLRPLAGG